MGRGHRKAGLHHALAEAFQGGHPVRVDLLDAGKVQRLSGQRHAGDHGQIGPAIHVIPAGIDGGKRLFLFGHQCSPYLEPACRNAYKMSWGDPCGHVD